MSLPNSSKSRIPHLQLHKRAINQSPSRLIDSHNRHTPPPGGRVDHTYKSISGSDVSDTLPETVTSQEGGTKMTPIEPEAGSNPNLGSQLQAVKAILREKPILYISLVGDNTDQGDIARVTECLSRAVDVSSVQEMSLYFVRTTCGTVRIVRPDGVSFQQFNNAILSIGYDLVDSYTVGSVLYILIQKKCSDQQMGATNKREYTLPQNIPYEPETQGNRSKTFSAHTLCNCDVVESPHYRNHPSLAAFPTLADQNVMENPHGDRDIPFRDCSSSSTQEKLTSGSMYVRGGDYPDSVIIDGLKKDITHAALVSKVLIYARQADLYSPNSRGGSKRDSTVEVVGGMPQGRKTWGSKILEIPPRRSSIGFQQKQILKVPEDLPEKPRTSTEHTIVQKSSSPLLVSVSANKLEKDDSLTRHTPQPEPSSTIHANKSLTLSSEERTRRFRGLLEYHWQPQEKQEARTSLYPRERYTSTLSIATHCAAESTSQIGIRSTPVPGRTTVATPRNYQATSCNISDLSLGTLRRSPLSKFDEIIVKHWAERQSSTPLNISQSTPFHVDEIITYTKVKEDPPIMSGIRPALKERDQNSQAANGKAGFPSTFRKGRVLRASSDPSTLPALLESHDETSYPFTSTTSKSPTIVPAAATLVASAKTKVAKPLRRTRRESSYNITTVNGGNWLEAIPEDSLSSAGASGVQLDPGFEVSNLPTQSRSDSIIELYQKMDMSPTGGDTQYSSVNENNRQPQITENAATRKTVAKSGKGRVWLRELLYKTGLKSLKK